MFDKNLLLQHISNRQRTVEQMLSEAKEGELHGRLRQAISNYYGIDPNHRNWSKIKPHADISKYGESVYDQFPDEITAEESQRDFMERLGDMHHELTSKKPKKD